MNKQDNPGEKSFNPGNQSKPTPGRVQSKADFFDQQAAGPVMSKPMMLALDPGNPVGSAAAFEKFRNAYMMSAIQLVKLRKEKTLSNPQVWNHIPFDSDLYLLVKHELQSMLSGIFRDREVLTLQETRFITHQLLRLEPVMEKLQVVHAETLKNFPENVSGGFDAFKNTLVSHISFPLNVIFRECGFYVTYQPADKKNEKFHLALFKIPKVFQLPPTYFAILMESGSENILHNAAVKRNIAGFHQFLESNAFIFDGAGFENTDAVQFKINHEIQHRVLHAISLWSGAEIRDIEHEYASYLAALMYSTSDYAQSVFKGWKVVDSCIEPIDVHDQAIRFIIKDTEPLASGNITDTARALLDIFHAKRFGKYTADGFGKTFTDFENECMKSSD